MTVEERLAKLERVIKANGDFIIPGNLVVNGNTSVSGALSIQGSDVFQQLGSINGVLAAIAARTLSVDRATVVIAAEGQNEAGDLEFHGGNAQEWTLPRTFGRAVVAAWPVIQDHHADINNY
jgi:hypothetical protein